MSWSIHYLEEAKNDLKKLDGSLKVQVVRGIEKVAQNPLPQSEGGYGKPLGNKNYTNLTGFLKIKFLNIGIRVVYYLVRKENAMEIVIVSARADNEVYREADKRNKKHNLM